jgi:hypothetical protein
MMCYDLNKVIDDHNLTVSIGTVVKVITLFDKIIPKCFYKGVPDYIPEERCKFCKEFQTKMDSESVYCRKHYAPKLYNNPMTVLSQLIYRNEIFTLFGRYALRITKSCTYAFYLTPFYIDANRFCVYAYPNEIFKDRKPSYIWSNFKKPGMNTFMMDTKCYMMDTTDKFHVTIKEM